MKLIELLSVRLALAAGAALSIFTATTPAAAADAAPELGAQETELAPDTAPETELAPEEHSLAPTTLPAPPDTRRAESEPRMRSRWYGWQTLATDGGAVALITAGGLLASNQTTGNVGAGMVGAGMLTYAFGGPIVHFGHHNPGRGFASFALRVPLPAVAGGVTAAISCRHGGEYCGLLAVPPIFVGVIVAVVVDAAALSRDEVPDAPAGARAFVTPTFYSDGKRTLVGLAGTL